MKRISLWMVVMALSCVGQGAAARGGMPVGGLETGAVAPAGKLVLDTVVNRAGDEPFSLSVAVPDGNYRVTVTLGSRRRAGQTVVRAESRRLMTESVVTRRNRFHTVSFVVNKRSPRISDGQSVRLKPREHGYLNWDSLLTLEFGGVRPAVRAVRIESDTVATTLFLCGNSTVVDQENEPYASWGQMIPRWFTDRVAVSNHAESGLSARTFIAGNRLEKVLSMMRPGDYVFCEFGHNDQKEHAPGDGAYYHFAHQLKVFVDRVRSRHGRIVFVTPTSRRSFDEPTQRRVLETHGDYPDAMRTVARREGVPLIELHEMTRTFFEALGYEGSKTALVHYPAHRFAGQDQPLADNTHFNPYGAYEVARMVVMGMKQAGLPLVDALRPEWRDFDAAHPDDPATFRWDWSRKTDATKPDGN